MKFTNDEAAIQFVKLNSKSTPKWVEKARKYSKELCALVEGENFLEELITKIEKIESDAKAEARKKYSQDIRDFFSRMFLPIENVFSSTGGVKNYQNGDARLSDANQKKLLDVISNVRDGKSIERYIDTQWMPLYHTDPAGVLWVRYNVYGTLNTDIEVYPTYQSIGAVRNYTAKGQLVENIIFEPAKVDGKQIWTVVDDAKQYTVIQDGDSFYIDNDPLKTFDHPFGIVPVIIISDLTNKYGDRLSPIDDIIGKAREYARDSSIKTIYKFLQGFPKHWRREAICAACSGTRKNGDQPCPVCSPMGKTATPSVTDVIVLPFNPEIPNTLSGNDIMGYNSPDNTTWEQFNKELELGERKAYETLWGVPPMVQIAKSEEQVTVDTQPMINKLNKYADIAEWIEWTITEWCANAIDTTKPKDKQISLIVYGRRYILEGIDTIQKKYENAKAAGENNVVLDAIFDELLTVKFKNDPECMRQELNKAQCEPYIHVSTQEVFNMFGAQEAHRKVYFQRWWKNLGNTDLTKDVKVLQKQFESDFKLYLPTLTPAQPAAEPKTEPIL